MNLKKLETFYWAAKLGSFTAAAERLNSTQSTVSMRIQELEREFNVRLFNRSRRVAKVTDLGRDMMHYVEQLLQISADMQDRISSPDALTGTLRVGVAEVISITWLPKLMREIHAQYPKVCLQLEEALTRNLVEKLEHGSLDLVLAPGEIPGRDFSPISLGTMQFAWMCSPGLGLPDRKIGPRELQNWPIITLSEESVHYSTIEDWFHADNARVTRFDTCKSIGVAASLATSGLGVTLLPVACFENQLAGGDLKIVNAAPSFPPVRFYATCARNSTNRLAQRAALLAQRCSSFDNACSPLKMLVHH